MRRWLPALAAAQAAGIAAADHGLVGAREALLLGALGLALAARLRRRARARVAALLAAAFAAGAHGLASALGAADAGSPARATEGVLEATVREVAAARPGALRVELDGAFWIDRAGDAPPGRVRLWLEAPPEADPPPLARALPGERVRARVRISAPGGRRNPGSPDPRVRARREGLAAVGRLVHPSLSVRLPERDGWRPLAPVHRARARAAARLAAFGEGGALLRALALGEQGALAPSLREACAGLGISHALSVSGLHLALVGGFAYALARSAAARSAALAARIDTRRAALVAALAAAGLYASLAGGAVPVVRSLAMLAAVATAALAGRRGAASTALAAAVLWVLAREPAALFDAGAQLSFAGSAALAGLLGARAAAPAERRGLRAALADGLRASATALLATAPIAAAHFGRSAPAALVANAVAVPWIGLALLPGALAAAALAQAPPQPWNELPLAGLAWLAAVSCRGAVRLAAVVPAPGVGAPPAASGLAAALVLAALGLRARSTGARIALASAQSAWLALAPPGSVAPQGPRAVFLDVGQGDATLLQAGDAAVLVDAGGAGGGGPDLGRSVVAPALRALGVRRVALLVVTHADLDHRGGVPGVLASLPVDELWLPFGALDDPDFGALRAQAAVTGTRVRESGAGVPGRCVGALCVTPLWPPREAGDGGARASRNDRSLVVRVETGGRSVLLPGDLEAGAEAALLASRAALGADVLKLPHHGSRSSSSSAFLAAVGASLAVASAPCEGRFGMPHGAVVRRVRAAGAALWWTGRDGAVRVALAGPLHALGTGEPARCAPGEPRTARRAWRPSPAPEAPRARATMLRPEPGRAPARASREGRWTSAAPRSRRSAARKIAARSARTASRARSRSRSASEARRSPW